jgi:hypothetical protein
MSAATPEDTTKVGKILKLGYKGYALKREREQEKGQKSCRFKSLEPGFP